MGLGGGIESTVENMILGNDISFGNFLSSAIISGVSYGILDNVFRGVKRLFGSATKDTAAEILEPLENGPYIKDGKPNGRPGPTGKAKAKFEQDIYNNQVSPDGILRDPNPPYEIIEWKPGQPKTGRVDIGHKQGKPYREMFKKYKNREITLDELKDFQSDAANFQFEIPRKNRSHKYE